MLPHPTVSIIGILLALQLVVFTASTIPGVRSGPGFQPLMDGWVQGGAYCTGALLCGLRAATVAAQRAIWWWICAALTARAVAFVLFFTVVRTMDPIPYPSISDVGWLAMYFFLLLGLIGLAGSGLRGMSASLLLDGMTGALAVAAVSYALLAPTLTELVEAGRESVVLVNLAYPALDFMLLLVIIGLLVAFRWRPPISVWALGVGVAGLAVGEQIFVHMVTIGSYRPGTMLSSELLWSMAIIAAAGWLPERAAQPHRSRWVPGLVLPGLFAITCLVVLLVAAARPIPPTSVVLAAAGMAIVIARTGLSFRTLRSMSLHRREARTDDLTGLANRRAFNEALAATMKSRADDDPFALLIVDLDDFKAVNDSLGHHQGDEVLVLVAGRLQRPLRDGDLLARIGGDEFAVIVARANQEAALAVAARMRGALRRPLDIAAREVTVSASVGVAVFPQDGRDPTELQQHADIAMYHAKVNATGQSEYRPQLAAGSKVRFEWSERLQRAIDGDELVLHYQPQVSLPDGVVVGVEALVRWQQPGLPLLYPDAFLHRAEGAGLMHQLTRNVLWQAARQCAAWRRSGMDITVAINLSVSDLLNADFPTAVTAALDHFGLPGSALEFELTEDLFMADPLRAHVVIGKLLDTGASLVVDDYGTGYSSLAYLRDLRGLSGLKLDRSFVTHLDTDDRSEAIVRSTVSMAAALGIRLIAEGVETAAVRDRLVHLGCSLAQGYLFCRPAPAAEVPFGLLVPASLGFGRAGRHGRG